MGIIWSNSQSEWLKNIVKIINFDKWIHIKFLFRITIELTLHRNIKTTLKIHSISRRIMFLLLKLIFFTDLFYWSIRIFNLYGLKNRYALPFHTGHFSIPYTIEFGLIFLLCMLNKFMETLELIIENVMLLMKVLKEHYSSSRDQVLGCSIGYFVSISKRRYRKKISISYQMSCNVYLGTSWMRLKRCLKFGMQLLKKRGACRKDYSKWVYVIMWRRRNWNLEERFIKI